ncbi:MAG: cyclodeaminase/cyclohydrolase family protein [Planctomycetota bacterium]
MSYRNISLERYLKMISEPTAVPGGGSVSAYAGALGSSLAAMAAAITCKKIQEKSKAKLCSESRKIFIANWRKLLKLAEEDSKSYEQVLKAFKIPHYKLNRRHRINQALVKAAEVPARTMDLCIQTLFQINRIKHLCPSQILTDINVGFMLTRSALRGARLNVLVNLESIKDKKMEAALQKQLEYLDKAAEEVLYKLEDWV